MRCTPREAQNEGLLWATMHQGKQSCPPCIAAIQVLKVRIRCTDVAWLGCGIRRGTWYPFGGGGGGGQFVVSAPMVTSYMPSKRKRAPLGAARAIIAGRAGQQATRNGRGRTLVVPSQSLGAANCRGLLLTPYKRISWVPGPPLRQLISSRRASMATKQKGVDHRAAWAVNQMWPICNAPFQENLGL